MTYVPNPFRVRLAEQQRDEGQFLRTFGVGMMDTLPSADESWDRLVVLRSAPGAGKTSLLRMFTPQVLRTITSSPDDFQELYGSLTLRKAIAAGEISVLGVLVGVGKDYRALVDLGPGDRGNEIVFFRLLDARIVVRYVEAALCIANLRFPDDAHRLTFLPRDGSAGEAASAAIDLFLRKPDIETSGERRWDGVDLLDSARSHEREVLRLLDSLLPVTWNESHGHSRPYSLQFLSGLDLHVDGQPITAKPVLLFDDVHDLEDEQRRALYSHLMDRTLNVGRWVAERYSALRDDELLTDASPEGRDVVTIRIEEALTNTLRGGRSRNSERLFSEIANSRARLPLSLAGYSADTFTSFLRGRDELNPDIVARAIESSRASSAALVEANPRFSQWFDQAGRMTESETPLRAAVRWRELEILIQRDLLKPAQTLFDDDQPGRPYGELTSSASRGAARLFLAREMGVPYYAGPDGLADLASRNVEQYLGLAGESFDLMLAALVLKRHPSLSAQDQDKLSRASSRRLWEAIPHRVPYGSDVIALLHAIAANGRSETYRPNAPYAPGVTGTAFPYVDRTKVGKRNRATESGHLLRFGQALASAIAHNLVQIEQPLKTKNGTWTVIYLNRLLCPYFDLPLQRGGFREQTTVRLADWLARAASAQGGGALPNPESPLPGVDRVAS